MINKLKSLKDHQGFMKYFKNMYNSDGTMVKLTYSSMLHNFGCKHTVELEEGIRKCMVIVTRPRMLVDIERKNK